VRTIFTLTTSCTHNFLCKRYVHITYEKRKNYWMKKKKKKVTKEEERTGGVRPHGEVRDPRSRSAAASVAPDDRLLNWFCDWTSSSDPFTFRTSKLLCLILVLCFAFSVSFFSSRAKPEFHYHGNEITNFLTSLLSLNEREKATKVFDCTSADNAPPPAQLVVTHRVITPCRTASTTHQQFNHEQTFPAKQHHKSKMS
jgi:hypothetical protein